MIAMSKKTDTILAIFSGILLVQGFQPLDLYILPWVALVPLLMALRGKESGTAFLLGWLTGFIWFLGTIYWIFHSVYFYGHIPAAVSVLMLVLLCLYLGSYVGLFSMLFNAVSKDSRLPALLTVPLLWVSLEFMRTYLLTGYPWALLAYSQYKMLALIQIADITGVYGVSFLVAALNGLIFDIVVNRERKRLPAAGIVVFTVIILISLFYGSGKLAEDEAGRQFNVSVVQGNIPQDKKWDSAFQKEVIDTYKRLTLKALSDRPDMVVWPETSLPFVFGYDEVLSEDTVSFAEGLGTHLLFGSIFLDRRDPEEAGIANSAILLSPEGGIEVYSKIHLVPYGEYIPFRNLIPFAKRLTAGIGDFNSGKEFVVMEPPFARIGNLICYEIIFPGLVRSFVERGADVLVTITNDAWFGRTSAPYQHFVVAVFRAIEHRVPVIRAANTGISGFIDSRGRIRQKSGIFVEAVLNYQVSAGTESTLYTEHGDIFAWLCVFGSLVLVTGRIIKGSGKKK
jgi:apolipoprotein N-acyltransferase